MNIYIRTIDNKNIRIGINQKDKINSIIPKIEAVGYVFNNTDYRNTFIAHGRLLDLDKTFADYNIDDLTFITWTMYKKGLNCPCCGIMSNTDNSNDDNSI